MHFHSHILWFPIGLICIVKANNINILAEFFDFSPLNYNRIYKKLDSSINQSKIYFDTLELENQWSCYNHDVILGNHIQLFNQYNSSFRIQWKAFRCTIGIVISETCFYFRLPYFHCHLPQINIHEWCRLSKRPLYI